MSAERSVAREDPAPRTLVERAVLARGGERLKHYVKALVAFEPADAQEHGLVIADSRAPGELANGGGVHDVVDEPQVERIGDHANARGGHSKMTQDRRLQRAVGRKHGV